jgi:hypothetical protein
VFVEKETNWYTASRTYRNLICEGLFFKSYCCFCQKNMATGRNTDRVLGIFGNDLVADTAIA